jgi:lactate dehydrogenase-like 2-hydroxyacid dehydrogenase
LNDDTRNLIDRKALNSCKKSLVIINTSRGGLVDEQNIINMLDKNLIGGYSTDVLVNENDSIKNSKLILKMKDDPRIIITPHVGGMTIEGQTKAYKWAINKL